MREWRVMLGPFLIWAAHFMIVYGVASVADLSASADRAIWRTTGLALTAACLIALIVMLARSRAPQSASPLARTLGTAGLVTSLVAITWQSLPLILSA